MAFSCLKFLGKQGISKPPTAFSPHTCFVSSRWRSQWIWTDKIMNNAKRRVGLLECEANQAWLNTWTRTVRGHKHPRQRSLCIFVATTLHNSLHFKVFSMDGAREYSIYLSSWLAHIAYVAHAGDHAVFIYQNLSWSWLKSWLRPMLSERLG